MNRLYLLLGVLLAGHALTLALGLNWRPAADWFTSKNVFFLASDVLVGLVLIGFSFSFFGRAAPIFVALLLALALITHALREVEYWLGVTDAYCFSRALEFFNLALLCFIGLLILISEGSD